jgi:adenine-specific DNA-methyltransferase
MKICTLKNTKAKDVDLNNYFDSNSIEIDPLELYDNTGKGGWFIGSPAEFSLKSKIEIVGKPLKDWDVKISRGIITGLNEAFIIDTNTKNRLCEQDPRSGEILQKILKGKDIKRFNYEWKGLWVILLIDEIKINEYKAISNYLEGYKDKLCNRAQFIRGDHDWYSIDNGPTLENLNQFKQEKIVYPETTQSNNFCFAPAGMFIEKTGFIMVGEDLKYIFGVLTSKLFQVMFPKCFAGITLGDTGYQLNKDYLQKFSIPLLDTPHKVELARQIEALVEEILKVKSTPSLRATPQEGNSDTSELEARIDVLVYKLYELTEEEIAVLES